MKLALLSDIHSNHIALRACLDHLASEKFDRLCMLGDIIAYGPRAKECLDTLRALNLKGALCLKGNHDDNVVRQEVPQGVSQDIGRYEIFDRPGLGREGLAWLESLPPMVEEGEMCFVHASPRQPLREYVDSEEKCRAALEASRARWIFCGHTHQPLWFSLSSQGARLERPGASALTAYQLDPTARHVINVGSVGESRDGNPGACYAVFDSESGRLEFRRVDYDLAAMVEDMKQQGYPEGLWRKREAEALRKKERSPGA